MSLIYMLQAGPVSPGALLQQKTSVSGSAAFSATCPMGKRAGRGSARRTLPDGLSLPGRAYIMACLLWTCPGFGFLPRKCILRREEVKDRPCSLQHTHIHPPHTHTPASVSRKLKHPAGYRGRKQEELSSQKASSHLLSVCSSWARQDSLSASVTSFAGQP